MSVTFHLTREKEPTQRQEFTFEDDLITLGRDDANVWRFASPLVSKRHTSIAQRDRSYYVEDLKSTNGTFLNNEKLPPGKSLLLRAGDRIRIGDCVIEVARISFPPPLEPQKDGARRLEPQPPVVEAPQADTPQVKIVEQNMPQPETRKMPSEVDVGSTRLRELDRLCAQLKEENRRLTEAFARVSRDVEEAKPLPEPREVSGVSSVVGEALKIFLRTFSRLARGRTSFYQEFMGTTFFGRHRSSFLDHVEESGVQVFLKEGANGVSAERLATLGSEMDDIVLHTMALLEGYRKSIDEGTRKILQRLSPDAINEELKNTNLRLGPAEISYRYLPVIRELKVRQVVRRRVEELLREDRGVLESRFFHDGFINGYQACLGSAKAQRREGKT